MIEIMVVVVIIGLGAALAVPNFARTNQVMADEAIYRVTRMSLHRCRAEAVSRARPTASPTTLAFFPNGMACIAWDDAAGAKDGVLGTGGIDLGPNGILDAGEGDGEVVTVYFQERFDRSVPLSEAGANAHIDTAVSTLQDTGGGQDDTTGYLLPIIGGGYFVSNTGSTFVAKLAMRSASGNQSYYSLYPSGQVIGN